MVGVGLIVLLAIIGAAFLAFMPTKASEREIAREVDKKKKVAARNDTTVVESAYEHLERQLEREIKGREKAESERDEQRDRADHYQEEASRFRKELERQQSRCEAQGFPCSQKFEPVELQHWAPPHKEKA